MHFLAEHRLLIGISADLFTFLGALILARDAFTHLKDLRERRIHDEFRDAFPDLPLADDEVTAAVSAVRFAIRGSAILFCGFILQILSRLSEEITLPK